MKNAVVLMAVAATLGSCAQLPSDGPSAMAMEAEVSAVSGFAYGVVDVAPPILSILEGRQDDTFTGSFPDRSGGATDVIGIGDTVQVVIWEAAAGGLFSAGGNDIATGSKSAAIPDQPVSTAGTIMVPYAGRIEAAGRTPEQVKATIEAALAGKAIEPQVLVSVSRSVYNTATVTGEVTGGGRIPLSTRGDRLLDVIAAAGGMSAPAHEVFVQLQRGKRTVRVPLQAVYANPAENIPIRPGDVISLVRDPQTFTAFGATGRNAEIPFEAKGISLVEAMGKAGGLLDYRANPAGVFVLRYEDPDLLSRLPVRPELQQSRASVPVVYRFDLRDPAGYFMAKSFRIYDKDTVYVANSTLTELQKFLLLLNTAVQPAVTGTSIANAVN